MSGSPALDRGVDSIRVWLDWHAYATRLLLRPGDDPWESAEKFIAFFGQAQTLLKPDVAVIDVRALYDSWLERHPDFMAGLAKRRPSQIVRRLLEQREPRLLLVEIIDATLSQLRGRVPLMVSAPSPRHWLAYADVDHASIQPEADDIEDAAMYLADLLRCIAETSITGLMLEERAGHPAMCRADAQLYRPIINVAKHYRWSLALRTCADCFASDISADDFAVLIAPGRPARVGGKSGIDVSRLLWSGGALPPLDAGHFYFAAIPRDERPEHVLDCLARIRGDALI